MFTFPEANSLSSYQLAPALVGSICRHLGALEMCAEGALSVAKVPEVPLGALYLEVKLPEGLLLSSNGMSYGGRLVPGREYTSMDEFYRN